MELKHPDKIFHFGVSPSMVSTWQICNRRFYNHYIRGMKGDSGPFALFGTAWHNFLDRIALLGSKTGANVDLAVEIAAFNEIFTAESNFETKYSGRTQAMAKIMIKKYLEAYPQDSEPFKMLEVQKKLQVDVPGLKKKLNMVIDGTMEYRNKLWLRENKTASQGGAKYFRQYRLDWQNLTYLMGMQIHTGRKIEGVFYDVAVAKKKIDDACFMRDDVVGCKTEDQIKYHGDQFIKVANRMVEYTEEHWKDVEAFEMSEKGNSCFSYNKECPYLDICDFNDNVDMWRG